MILLFVVAAAVGVSALVVTRHRSPSPPDVAPAPPGPAPPSAAAPNVPDAGARHAATPPPREPLRNDPGDEGSVMERIRPMVRADPDGALALIDAADRAHPVSPFAEERAALRVDALVFARRIGPARDAAEEFLQRYPRGPRAQHIEMLTGVHPRPPEPEN